MPCSNPVPAVDLGLRPDGKRNIHFTGKLWRYPKEKIIHLPCGKCDSCLLARARSWAVRCYHEASIHADNCFVTLTYSPDRLPVGGSLVKKDFQDFLKRLRKAYPDVKLKYFMCGEYGENLSRPHYHACIFNFDFSDRVFWDCRDGVRLYRSAILEKLWPFGFSTVGDVTIKSASYVARYVVKKVRGKKSKEYYGNKLPEYTCMSRRPGIGSDWYDLYRNDCFPDDFCVVEGGVKLPVPSYYFRKLDLTNPDLSGKLKEKRIKRFTGSPDNTLERLAARGRVLSKKLETMRRNYESASV